jgi:hypothetical protein
LTFQWSPEDAWEEAKYSALAYSKAFYEAGYAKQVYNRLTEPFQMMRTVLSGTELNNFFWLRDHGAADPSLAELARCMREAKEASTPLKLNPGEWHLPYVSTCRSEVDGSPLYFIDGEEEGREVFLTVEDAKKVSAARCAAVSFRNIDYGVEKSREVYARLVGDDRKHASAFCHQATPMQELDEFYVNDPQYLPSWEPGVSHMDRDGQLWSAQYRGWVMQRKLIPGENIPG